GLLVADISTGIYAMQATGAALYRRLAHGMGAHVDMSLLDVAAAFQNGAIVDQALANWNTVTPYSVPAGTFKTLDGYINVTSLHDRMFVGLCKAIGRHDWMTDARFATAANRFELADEIYDTLHRMFREQPTSHWLAVMREHGVVCGKVSDYAEFIDDPHVRHRQIFREGRAPGFGPVPIARLPGALSEFTATRSPRCGEHTQEILDEMGINSEAQRALIAAGVVVGREAGPT
ncbi:MAG TPA: CoA transferase, partial [Burkholderiaceae bacterium]|nr:CoA transferase [Burkholderiaceae bacterium]